MNYAQEYARYMKDRQTGAWRPGMATVSPQKQVQYVEVQRPAPQVQYVEVPVSPPKQVQYVQVQRPRPAPQVQYVQQPVQQPVQQQVQYVVAPQPVRQRGRQQSERASGESVTRGKVSERASNRARRAIAGRTGKWFGR